MRKPYLVTIVRSSGSFLHTFTLLTCLPTHPRRTKNLLLLLAFLSVTFFQPRSFLAIDGDQALSFIMINHYQPYIINHTHQPLPSSALLVCPTVVLTPPAKSGLCHSAACECGEEPGLGLTAVWTSTRRITWAANRCSGYGAPGFRISWISTGCFNQRAAEQDGPTGSQRIINSG